MIATLTANKTNWRELTTINHTGVVRSVHCSPDGRFIASGSFDKTVSLYDKNGNIVKTFSGYSDMVQSVCFNSDSTTLAVGLIDGKIVLLNVESEQQIMNFDCDSLEVFCMSFSSDGSKLVAGTKNNMIAFDVNTGRVLFKTTDDNQYYYSVCFSSDDSMIVAGCEQGIKVWSVSTYQLIRTIQDWFVLGKHVYSVCFSFDGSKIIAGGFNKNVTVWATASGSLLMTLTGHDNFVSSVCMSRDGSMIVSGSEDKTIKVWNAATGDLIQTLDHMNWVRSVCLGCNDTLIVSGSSDSSVKLWR